MSKDKQSAKLDCQSKKFLAKISRDEVNRLRESKPSLFENREKMGIVITELAANRAMIDFIDRPKLLISSKYPLKVKDTENLTNKSFNELSLLDSMPWFLELQENWLFFEDKSVILVCSPSEETRSCARFFSEMSKNPACMEMLGFDEIDFTSLNNLMSVGLCKSHLLPMSANEFNDYIESRLAQEFTKECKPSFWINLSNRELSQKEMLGLLLQASESGLDTLSSSVKAKIDAIAENALNEIM